MRLTKQQSEMLTIGVIVLLLAMMACHLMPSIKLAAHEMGEETNEEEGEQEEKAETDPAAKAEKPRNLVGETDPQSILEGVKQASRITYPENTRSLADSLYGANRAEGLCGRDTKSNLDAAIARAKEGYERNDCAIKRYYNMPGHLEAAILGKAKLQ